MEDNKTLGNEAAEAASVPAVPMGATGLEAGSPAVQSKISEIMKMRGRDYLRAGIGGAAAGLQASQGALSPLAAFVQGTAAGMQIPAQIFAQKQQQVKSTIDAMPFANASPEVFKGLLDANPNLKWLGAIPNAMALEMVKTIGVKSAEIYEQGKKEQEMAEKGQEIAQQNKIFDMALKTKDPASLADQLSVSSKFQGLKQVEEYQIAKPAYEAIVGAQGAAGDKTMLVNFARLLSPTIRVNEGTMAAVDVSGLFDKATAGLWAKATRGEELTDGERKVIRAEATRLYNLKEKDFNTQSHLWKEKAAEAGFDPRIIDSSFGKAQPMIDKQTGSIIYVVPKGDGTFIEVGR